MEYHQLNANNMNTAAWLLANGSAGNGVQDGATLTIEGGSVPITDHVDWSALAEGIVSIETGKARTGPIGTAAAPFKADVTGFLKHGAQSGWWYYAPEGDDDLCTKAVLDSPAGGLSLVGTGTVADIEHNQGELYVGTSVVVDDAIHLGGRSTYEYNADVLDSISIYGGVHTLRRDATRVDVHDGATLILELDQVTTPTMEIYQHGKTSRVIRRRGAVPKHHLLGGTCDLTESRRDEAWAATTFRRAASRTTLIKEDRHTTGTTVWVGGGAQGQATPIPA